MQSLENPNENSAYCIRFQAFEFSFRVVNLLFCKQKSLFDDYNINGKEQTPRAEDYNFYAIDFMCTEYHIDLNLAL